MMNTMKLEEFARIHLPALEADEVRFNVPIAVLTAAAKNPPAGFAFWSLGAPGHCAIRSPGRPILLGNLNRAECHRLAEDTIGDDCGAIGADDRPHWFAERASALGAKFDPPIPQRINVLESPPRHPNVPGSMREVTVEDAPLLLEWLTGFHQEAVPHDPAPEAHHVEKAAGSGRYLFWTVDGQPVSVAGIARGLRHTGCVAPVYTPPEQRNRSYAGAATAAVVERLFAEGKTATCLFTDLRNPMSNRCYAKIGFKPYCDAWLYLPASA
jgi:RimJ/RimL family protein N-acetyltransferase